MKNLLSFLFLLAFSTQVVAEDDAFELRDGDRVIFLGNSFFERAIDYGVIETMWSIRWPDRNISFRNVGWDGDTVYGHSRAGGRRRAVFGDAEEGFQRLVAHINRLKPTVIVVAYGSNESFDGAEGEAEFAAGLRRLIGELSNNEVRFIFLSTVPMQSDAGEDNLLKSAIEGHIADRNEQLKNYNTVIQKIANEGSHSFVDLFTPLLNSNELLTANGIHLNRSGYEQVANITAEQLHFPKPKITSAERIENIRETVAKKNRLYFHRWRPRNDAFVYGERKDEQKIAQTEPEKFEPFVARQEEAIRALLQK